jgi:hypothetical protein
LFAQIAIDRLRIASAIALADPVNEPEIVLDVVAFVDEGKTSAGRITMASALPAPLMPKVTTSRPVRWWMMSAEWNGPFRLLPACCSQSP